MDYFKKYLQFCLFRRSLSDLPKSIPYLQASLVFYLIFGFLIQANISDPVEAVLETLIEIVLTTILIFILLIFAGKFSSFIQTFTAFISAENLMFALLLPLAIWLDFSDDIISMYICGTLSTLYLIWYMLIISYTIRQLLSITKTASFILSLSYSLITFIGPFVMLQF